MHRFVWDLRYPRPNALKYDYSIAAVWTVGTPIVPMGPLVMPGKYKIVLSIEGKNFTQELNVKLDPRIEINTNDLQNQLTLALQIQNTLSNTVKLYNDVNSEMKKDRRKIKLESIEYLSQIVVEITEVSRVISGLASSIQTADAAPTQGQNNLFNEYRKQFEQLEKKWIDFKMTID